VRARRTRWALALLSGLGALGLFSGYYLQSRTVAVRSDGGSVALQAWDMLHGNLLLRHWHMSDVSFWSTELVQYALLEAVHGLGPGVVHLGGAMTYTLLLVLAAVLAAGRVTGREALVRVLIVVAVMVAPAAAASPTLLLTPDHLGSAVPVLLAWLAVDRLSPPGPNGHGLTAHGLVVRWLLPVLVMLLLAWGQVADSLVLLTGAAPMALACGIRAAIRLRHRPPGSFPWLEVRLAAAALLSAGLAHGAEALIRISGGYVLRPVATTLVRRSELVHVIKLTVLGVAALFGVSFSGRPSRPELFFSAVHLITLLAVAVAGLLALTRLGRAGDLMIGGLALGIVINVAAYVTTPYAQNLLSTRELAAVLPLGAVLAGRQLAGPLAGPLLWARRLRGRRLRAGLLAVLATVLVLDVAALGYHAAQPARPADNQALANWLVTHHLTTGLSTDYWVANSTTLDAGGQVTVRQISINHHWRLARPVTWGSRSDWYDPNQYRATFIVVDDARPGAWIAEWRGAVHAFGRPARTLHPDGYTVLVWHRNLLAGIR
jgi:hypothetical protein